MPTKVKPKTLWSDRMIEQIGSYDPMPNKRNEKMVAINYERLRYWISKNARPSRATAELFGNKQRWFIHVTIDNVFLCVQYLF